MNLILNDEDQALKQQFDQFAKEQFDKKEFASNLLLKNMANAGYLGLNVPTEYGGKDSPFLHLVLLAEALAHYDAGIVLYFAYHAAVIELIKAYGSAEQKKTYLSQLASGNLLGTIAYLHETLELTAESVLDEKKALFVKTEFKTLALVSTFFSPLLAPANSKNNFFLLDDLAKTTERRIPMGLSSVSFADLHFVKYQLKKARWLGEQATAENSAEQFNLAQNIVKTLIAAAALGMAESVLNHSVACAKVTKRGDEPMTKSEAIQWKLADLSAESDAARLLVYRAAWSKDEDSANFNQYAAMCKSYTTRMARFHSGEGLQILTPLSLDNSADETKMLTHFYADSKILETFESTNEEEKVWLSHLIGIE